LWHWCMPVGQLHKTGRKSNFALLAKWEYN